MLACPIQLILFYKLYYLVIMERKKLSFQDLTERLSQVFESEGNAGYCVNEPARMYLIQGEEKRQLVVALKMVKDDGAKPDCKMVLYYPVLHEVVIEDVGEWQSHNPFRYNYSKKKKFYGPYLFLEVSEDEQGQQIFLQCIRFIWNRMLPESKQEAEAFLNARFLLSSEPELVDRAWDFAKEIRPYVWEKTVGYCYTFTDSSGIRQTWLINSSCNRVDNVDGLTFLAEPKLFPVDDGYMYFDGHGFYARKSKYLNKDEIRVKFHEVLKEYPAAIFYGHLIPVYYNSKPYWLVGISDKSARWSVLISPENEEIKKVHRSTERLLIATPNDDIFFKK